LKKIGNESRHRRRMFNQNGDVLFFFFFFLHSSPHDHVGPKGTLLLHTITAKRVPPRRKAPAKRNKSKERQKRQKRKVRRIRAVSREQGEKRNPRYVTTVQCAYLSVDFLHSFTSPTGLYDPTLKPRTILEKAQKPPIPRYPVPRLNPMFHDLPSTLRLVPSHPCALQTVSIASDT
jgi:hypothetical protein